MLVFIGKLLPSTVRWVPMCQGFSHFSGICASFCIGQISHQQHNGHWQSWSNINYHKCYICRCLLKGQVHTRLDTSHYKSINLAHFCNSESNTRFEKVQWHNWMSDPRALFIEWNPPYIGYETRMVLQDRDNSVPLDVLLDVSVLIHI